MSTPAGRSRRIRLSTVLGDGSRMSMRRLCVRISKCSRESLSTWGLRMTQYTAFSVGSGTGPATRAPVRVTVSTILRADWSMISWSYALRRMRIFWFIGGCRALLLEDLDDAAGADGAATLTDREPQPLGHRDRGDQPHGHLGVVPRHRHLGPLRQAHLTGHIGGPEVKLRPVVVEKRRMSPTLLPRQHVHLRGELGMRRDTARPGQHLATLHVIAPGAPQQHPDVVAGLPLIQQLAEHLHPGHHRLGSGRADPNDLHLPPNPHHTLLHPAGHHRPPTD